MDYLGFYLLYPIFLFHQEYQSFQLRYADKESGETLADITSDADFEPLRGLLSIERFNYVKEAFEKLDYRERLVIWHFVLIVLK